LGVRRLLFASDIYNVGMNVEQNKELIQRYVDELNRRRMAILDELVADDVILGALHYSPAADPEVVTREVYRQMIAARINAFPDYHVTVEEMIAEDDQVVVYWTSRGTHRGEFMGVLPTGKQIRGAAVSIYRVVGGRIAEVRGIWDRADTWQQLGLIAEESEILATKMR
jgi:steroid delta-isomerase-like uncharacterized protein